MLSDKRIERYFSFAEKACEFSDFHGTKKVKIGAVLIYKNKPVSLGWNTDKTNPLQKHYNSLRSGFDTNKVRNTVHAEMMCLLKAKELEIDFSKCSLFVFRKKCDGSLGISKPCKACREYIKQFGLKEIYYTTEEGFCYERKL